MLTSLEELVQKAQNLGKITAGVIDPRSELALSGALNAYQRNIIDPILIGPQNEIQAIADKSGLDISKLKIINAKDDVEASNIGAELAANHEVHLLIKGSLHTNTMLHAVLTPKYGLRTDALMSSASLMEIPSFDRLIFLADMVINIAPDLEQKIHILNNAVKMAKALGYDIPKVSIIDAVEEVNFKMPATLDAAIIAKMADRGQIKGAIVDGPIDLDIAVSELSATVKQFKSPIMGDADILLLPDLRSANILYKALIFMAKAHAADVILGAKIPIVVTSRSDDADTRLYSIAAASLISHQNIRENHGH